MTTAAADRPPGRHRARHRHLGIDEANGALAIGQGRRPPVRRRPGRQRVDGHRVVLRSPWSSPASPRTQRRSGAIDALAPVGERPCGTRYHGRPPLRPAPELQPNLVLLSDGADSINTGTEAQAVGRPRAGPRRRLRGRHRLRRVRPRRSVPPRRGGRRVRPAPAATRRPHGPVRQGPPASRTSTRSRTARGQRRSRWPSTSPAGGARAVGPDQGRHRRGVSPPGGRVAASRSA